MNRTAKDSVPSDGQAEGTEPAYRRVADQLRGLIMSGDLVPGEKLPSESELSSMFGVGRSTMREALRVLASRDLIYTKRGVTGGSFIAHPRPQDVSDYLETSFNLLSGTETVSVAELLEARALLEVPASRFAADRHTDRDVELLKRALDDEQEALGQGFEGHRRFHAVILEAADNGLLTMLTQPLFSTLRSRFLRNRAPQSFWAQVIDDHALIYESIAAGDAEAAGSAMEEHLQHLRGTYEEIDRLADLLENDKTDKRVLETEE